MQITNRAFWKLPNWRICRACSAAGVSVPWLGGWSWIDLRLSGAFCIMGSKSQLSLLRHRAMGYLINFNSVFVMQPWHRYATAHGQATYLRQCGGIPERQVDLRVRNLRLLVRSLPAWDFSLRHYITIISSPSRLARNDDEYWLVAAIAGMVKYLETVISNPAPPAKGCM